MILDLRNRHAGDVILAMPALQTLINSGISVTVIIARGYWGLLSGFDIELTDAPNIHSDFQIPNIPDVHVTQYWLTTLQTTPSRTEWSISLPAEFSNYVIISPDSRDYARRIETSFWRQAVNAINQYNKTVVVVGPPDAVKYNSDLCNELEIENNLTGKDTPERLIGLIKHADCVLSTDTATGHLSDSIGTPTITLSKTFLIDKFHPFWNPRIARHGKDVEKYLHEIFVN